MKRAVMCIAQTQAQADAIVSKLSAAGFTRNDVSALFPNTRGTMDFVHEHNTKAPEGAIAGVGAGGVLGGSLGLLAGIGALAIPGVGPLIAAGPILAAMSGAAAGAAIGGIAGALVGIGIPEMEARRYEGKILRGNILLSVHTETAEQRKRAEAIFTALGAQDICTAWERSVRRRPRAHHQARH